MFIAEHGGVGELPIERIGKETYEDCVEELTTLYNLNPEEENLLRKTGFIEYHNKYLWIHKKGE